VSATFACSIGSLGQPAPTITAVAMANGSRHAAVPFYPGLMVILGTGKNIISFVANFYVLDLPGYDFILGKPWLCRFNPDINW
jgi:hypothetical protein